MRIDLNVPFIEKDKVRKLGAHWDNARKTWYVENVKDLDPFLPYMKLNPKLTLRKTI